MRLSDLENQFTCTVCGRKGAEVRPDFDWNTRLRSKIMREALTRAIGDPRFVEAHPSGKAVVNGGANRKQTRNEPSDRPSAEDHPSLGEMRESGVRGIIRCERPGGCRPPVGCRLGLLSKRCLWLGLG